MNNALDILSGRPNRPNKSPHSSLPKHYRRALGKNLGYNLNADLDGEIAKFLTNKAKVRIRGVRYRITPKEQSILRRILKLHSDAKIARKTTKRNLEKLLVSVSPSKYSRYIKRRVSHILSLKGVKSHVSERTNKSRESIRNLEKEFPSIDNVRQFIRSLKRLKSTKRIVEKKLAEAKRNHYGDNALVTIGYYGHRRDRVTVKDLKGILQAINYNIEVDTYVASKSKGGKVNYKEMKRYVNKHPETTKGIVSIYRNAVKYVGMTESNRYLRREVKKYTGLDIKSEPWCAAFVKMILKKSGYSGPSRRMNYSALSALGVSKTGWHIGISAGGGRFIDGNSGRHTDRVTRDSVYRGYRSRGFVGWVLPGDIGNRRKVHYSKRNIPSGAIIVFARGKNVARKAKYTRLYLQGKISRSKFNRYTG